MGRKSNSKQNTNKKQPSPPKEKFLFQKRKELFMYVEKLLQITSMLLRPSLTPNKLWGHFMDVSGMLTKIQEIEACILNTQPTNLKRHLNIDDFKKWLSENGASFEGVEISQFDGYDLGLKAGKDFNEGVQFLSIPRKVMMTEKDAKESELKPFIDVDPLLKTMPNIALALFLHLERSNADSFWKPYIDILPTKYSTILYFTLEEMAELRPSPVLEQSLRLYRSIARQYAYFYNKIFTEDLPILLKLRDTFSFENYRWAVSTVMTRQNNIPMANLDHTTFIPLWDMCNHEHGKITTDFNKEKMQAECFTLRNFKKGEQIFIFYGGRPNSDLFLHNGFVYPDNKQDNLSISLGISSSDPQRETKLKLLNKLGLANTTQYNLYNTDAPIVPELLAFIRIFKMNEEELTRWMTQDMPSELLSLEPDGTSVGPGVDKEAFSYLMTRCELLLTTYRKRDTAETIYGDVSVHRNNIQLLKQCEMNVLNHTITYLKSKIASLPAEEKPIQ